VARGNRRWGRILAVLALIVIVLLVILDRVGVVVAEDTVAKQARAQLASEDVTTSGNPSVTINGFPFLTQVLAGHYDKINIVVPDPTSKGVRLDSLNVTATGVNAPTGTVISGNGQVKADRVVGTAQIAWAAFEQMIDLSGVKQYGIEPSTLKINGTDDGAITMSAPVTLLGQSFTAIATGTVTLSDDLLHVKITQIKASGGALEPVVASALQSLVAQLTFDVRVPELPYHLKLQKITTTAGGVNISASAVNVTLAS
jgi:hypothetical protein